MKSKNIWQSKFTEAQKRKVLAIIPKDGLLLTAKLTNEGRDLDRKRKCEYMNIRVVYALNGKVFSTLVSAQPSGNDS